MLRAFFWALVGTMRVNPRRLPSATRQISWFALLFFLSKSARVDEITYEARMSSCRGCPLFNRKRQTCGTGGWNMLVWTDRNSRRNEPLGCLCYMPAKARFAAASCWLFERGGLDLGGWQPELNDITD